VSSRIIHEFSSSSDLANPYFLSSTVASAILNDGILYYYHRGFNNIIIADAASPISTVNPDYNKYHNWHLTGRRVQVCQGV
jgi:hypothetical protein